MGSSFGGKRVGERDRLARERGERAGVDRARRERGRLRQARKIAGDRARIPRIVVPREELAHERVPVAGAAASFQRSIVSLPWSGARGARRAASAPGRRDSARTRASAARRAAAAGYRRGCTPPAHRREQRVGHLHRADPPALRFDVDGTRRIEPLERVEKPVSNAFASAAVGAGRRPAAIRDAARALRGRAPARRRRRARR